MLNPVSQNWTRTIQKEVSWRPSRVAVQTALSSLGTGLFMTLCSVPAIAASRGADSGLDGTVSDFLFLGFLGGIALAPLLSLFTSSLLRIVMERKAEQKIPELDIRFSPEAMASMTDRPYARPAHLPNTRFGQGRVDFHRLPKSLEVELCTGTLG